MQYQGMHQWRRSPEGPCSFRTLKPKGQERDLEEIIACGMAKQVQTKSK